MPDEKQNQPQHGQIKPGGGTVQVNVAELDKAFQQALKSHAQKAPDSAQAAMSGAGTSAEELGLASITDVIGQIGAAQETFCAVWPKVRGFIKMAVSIFGIFQPTLAAKVSAFIETLDTKLMPMICSTST